ncbi:MAG: hypothetical protein RJA99_4582 [Pseudomonadota bacterium]|jgi:hypothetical protein
MRRHLERLHSPRLLMSGGVALTGGAAFVASFVMLRVGLDGPALRWPLAVVVAWGVFLALLAAWLPAGGGRRADDEGPGLEDVLDAADAASDLADLTHRAGRPSLSTGGGGHFGGGGARAGLADVEGAAGARGLTSDAAWAPAGRPLEIDDGAASGPGLGLDVDIGDADEGAVLLLVVAGLLALVAVAAAAAWIIWTAPVLLAELLVDVGLARGLYRRLQGADSPNWLWTAIRRTALPFAAVIVMAGVAGWAVGIAAPGATTLGEALGRL